MGQSVCTDREPSDLKTVFQLGQAPQADRAAVAPPSDGSAKHHLKAWKFEKQGRAVIDSPAPLCDVQGVFSMELQRTCSYLILQVFTLPAEGAEETAPACSSDASPSALGALQELAANASATCTPRGLTIEVVTQSEVGGYEGKGPQLRYAIFVWHGTGVDPHVKARAFTKAFELDRLLRVGLLSELGVEGSSQNVVELRGSPSREEDGSSPDIGKADTVRRSGNRLLTMILDGVPKATSSPTSLLAAVATPQAANRGVGVQRFPRLGLSVCRSLGVAPTDNGNLQRPLAADGAASAPSAPSAPARSSAPPPLSLGRLAPGNADGKAAAPSRGDRAVVPRLQLGSFENIGKRNAAPYDDPASTAPASMEIDSIECEPLESGGRKRGRGPDVARPSTRSTTAPSSATVPKSARTDLSLPLQSPRPSSGVDDQCSGNDLSGQALSLQQNSMRTDAPAMLNLEEINRTDEELIRSFDPNNEENNYHLPNRLYKQLQLEHYRPVCSEVIENSLYISGYKVAEDLECLRRHGITHIVNAAADVCTNLLTGNFHYLTYYLKDANTEEISKILYRTLKWIDDAVQKSGRVLVHCREGVSRSATIVMAYLMWRYSMTFEAANDKLRRVRAICNPNTGFTCQLLVLGKRIGVGGGGQPQAPPSDRPGLFRVAPHDPREPFLLLLPAELLNWPSFDPRFGWVVQRGSDAVLWIGSQVADVEATQSAVHQHYALVLLFERLEVRFTVVQDGLEPPQFWQLLGLARPPDRSNFTAVRPDFDDDAEILARLPGALADSSPVANACDLEITSAREEKLPSSPTSVPAPATDQLVEREPQSEPETSPRPEVPCTSGVPASPVPG